MSILAEAQIQVGLAQSPDNLPDDEAAEILQVGIGGTPPFLVESVNGDFQGIVPDIWETIAFVNGWEYELILQTETQAALDAVATGELDLLVGPFSITAERLEAVDFTQPFFISGLGVLLPEESPPIWERVRPFFTRTALSSVGVLLVCLFLVGNGMWLVERRHNPEEFPNQYLRGVGNGMWFALVTLTTVGYGDRSPKTPWGRFIAGVWMLISLIAVSSLIGGLASAFTLALAKLPEDAIRDPGDLRGTRMAVVQGTTGEALAAEYRAKVVQRPSLEEAIALMEADKADGVIFDRPTLEYYLSQNPDLPLRVADFNLNTENLGFVLPYDSPLALPLDVSIVALEEDGTLVRTAQDWLQGNSI
ncbi:transporter substrate-binding domain-containing protein [Picosynechococcus sp. PCC 73109]|uniref:transporter substrate-binding domain-containing protein n=1 Tax=Picosynechococcus sp. PCC 73109 TaxID=374982 RepID=UPI001E2B4A25|nr:transporter substrate-binding domain-containing protein [Picosynechococcus sp. PCC 73109]